MDRNKLKELHCIMPITNIPTVMELGIRRTDGRRRSRTSPWPTQRSRIDERVSGSPAAGRCTSTRTSTFTARNPMMYRRLEQHASLCVLSVGTGVLDLPDAVVTDRNASVDFVRFAPAPNGIAIVDEALTFAQYWTHADHYEQIRRKQAKQAEVLVPDRVDPKFIRGAYVSCPAGQDALVTHGTACKVKLRPSLFFKL